MGTILKEEKVREKGKAVFMAALVVAMAIQFPVSAFAWL